MQNGLPFNLVNSTYWIKMVEGIGEFGVETTINV